MDNNQKPKQQASEEFQEAQQINAPSSPRRRKPPLDLDTALFLQSQASYVQTPNTPTVKSCGGLSPFSSPLASPARISIQQQQVFTGNSAITAANTTATATPTNATKASSLDSRRQSSAAFIIGDTSNTATVCRGITGTISAARTGRQQNPYYHQYYHSNNNISVDYIDCVSNDDLQPAPAPPGVARPTATTSWSNMKGIPHCRKHLRFHRNRVEPRLAGSQDSTSMQGEQHQQGSSSSSGSTTADNNNNRPDVDDNGEGSGAICGRLGDAGEPDGQAKGANGVGSMVASNSSSVLYPISVDEVKKRTYFIGSVSQDSLLGHDELFRYFPNGKVSIFVCTWNQNRKRAPTNLNDLLLPDQLIYMPDIYAIGIQEAFSSQTDHIREWEIELQTTLGPNHVLLHSCSLGVLHLALFVRRDLIWFCSTPEESVYNSRSMPTNMINTKGAVSIAFRFFGTSFMFTNCHFPAHEHRLKDRIEEYQRIINSIDLPKNLKLLKPRYLSNDSTARFDCAFFMGDLNFRLEQRTFDETIHILEDIFQHKEPSYEALTQNDELLKVMETNQAFHGFDESPIKFPPTYKFLAQTNKYDRRTRRVPSYTDRILFRSKRQRHIQCLLYDWLPQLLSSDHKPVYCLFDVLVRPGREQNMVASLNAGLFQRAIYLEALKRRAEDPNSMRDNGASGSLICSIS